MAPPYIRLSVSGGIGSRSGRSSCGWLGDSFSGCTSGCGSSIGGLLGSAGTGVGDVIGPFAMQANAAAISAFPHRVGAPRSSRRRNFFTDRPISPGGDLDSALAVQPPANVSFVFLTCAFVLDCFPPRLIASHPWIGHSEFGYPCWPSRLCTPLDPTGSLQPYPAEHLTVSLAKSKRTHSSRSALSANNFSKRWADLSEQRGSGRAFPGTLRFSTNCLGMADQGIIKDQRGQEQPKDTKRAQQVHKSPAAGPHGKEHLTDANKTPGSRDASRTRQER